MEEPRNTLLMFQEGYTKRDVNQLDPFMKLFSTREDIEMIGIGATKPSDYEWYIGYDSVREMIKSDWDNWGDVQLIFGDLKLNQVGDVAWFSVPAVVKQVNIPEDVWDFFVGRMKEILESDDLKPSEKLREAGHFGIRRSREESIGPGHPWKCVITGVLLNEEGWKIHTLHWSMPVE